ncbi:MAG TPA: hypothetical protein VLG10_16965 [Methylomirabilota bacterium]|nr:hypothetical protein [Methylomirabilota bacterium]
MPSPKPGSLEALVDVDRGIISREIFVSEEIYHQELEHCRPSRIAMARGEIGGPGSGSRPCGRSKLK